MAQQIRVFFAHSANSPIEDIQASAQKIKGLFLEKGATSGRDLSVSIVLGRDDFRVNCRGDWDVWAKSITKREHAMTRKPYYDVIVIPTQYVGRATAQIVGHAVKAGRPVFLYSDRDPEWGPLQRITHVYPYDTDDWQGGYKCESKEKKDE